jgi:hypothetical protein
MEECPICLLPLDNTITITGCCKKPFHTECYLRCMQEKTECPLCRSLEHGVRVTITNETTPLIVVHQQPENRCVRFLGNLSIFMFALYTLQYIAYQIK